MPAYIIPIHGLIGSPESPEDKEVYFTYDAFLMHVNKAKDYDSIVLDIASDGGYTDIADKMISVLQAVKKPIVSQNSGNVCSAASKLFTLAPKGSRLFNPSKGVFLIHNPWTEIQGDSAELAAASKALQDTENQYAKWYANATGSDLNVIKAYMGENVPLTPEQVEGLGFATLVEPTINAVAKLKSSINNMENKEFTEKINVFEKFLDKISAKFKIKAVMVADVNGTELEFPELTDPSEIAAGVKVTEGGSPANGEYPQPDGSIFVCENGVLKEIKPKAGDDSQALKDEIAALKAENETLKSEKTTAEANASESLKGLNDIKAEFKKFKAQFSKGNPGDNTPPAGGTGSGTEKKYVSKDELEKMI